jgi:hypothetical protein
MNEYLFLDRLATMSVAQDYIPLKDKSDRKDIERNGRGLSKVISTSARRNWEKPRKSYDSWSTGQDLTMEPPE